MAVCLICGEDNPDVEGLVCPRCLLLSLDGYQGEAMRTGKDASSAELAVGLCEEAGEVAGVLKKFLFHGHRLDHDKLTEELGDVLWHVAAIAKHYGLDLSQVAKENVMKLRARYPNGFSPQASQNRPAYGPDLGAPFGLTPEQVAEVERLMDGWKPPPLPGSAQQVEPPIKGGVRLPDGYPKVVFK